MFDLHHNILNIKQNGLIILSILADGLKYQNVI